MILGGGIGLGYRVGRKWCKLCRLWYPDEEGEYCPIHHKRFRLRPRSAKSKKNIDVPREE